MSPVPLIPDSAPFSSEQRAWLNGFFAGVFSRAVGSQPSTLSSGLTLQALQPLTILFGSQTGTAEGLAKKMAKEAGKRGFAATVLDMAQVDVARLAGEKNLLIITSTYGDGEPPDNAKALHAALQAAGDRPLTAVRYSVCSLGDTNYARFCQCGKDLDASLERLGAKRVTPRTDCDLDYDAPFTAWLDAALNALGSSVGASSLAISESIATKVAPTSEESGYSKKNPFPARVLTVRNLNGPGSAKEVNHVEFSLEGSGLTYEAGDALGVVPQNCPALVADLLIALGCDGEEAVTTPAGDLPLRRALTECYDLGKPSAELVSLVSSVVAGLAEPGRPGSPTPATGFHHVIDVLLAAPAKPSPAALVGVLKKIQPRLYSISSSPKAHAGQVHLTVGAVRYEKDGRPRKGVCSTFLADRGLAAGKVGVFVHSNKAFRPPANGDTPMIMVGPGTGIAPFRAFLAERRATGAKGKNWLFFGDQKASTDFLYREELAGLQEAGVLTRLDLAFSRDQAEKIYVQQRMLEAATEFYAWLEAGAHFYVCGDASRMAKDVDAALHRVIEQAGGKSPEAASAYVQTLKSTKRYSRDVY